MRLSSLSTVHHHPVRNRLVQSIRFGILWALASPAFSQSSVTTDTTDLDAIAVTGIRGSMTSSMNLKRDSPGVMDGIVAEDIGKFPDTNLAESLQRISGVSIDRTDSGEGSRVTVRGVGPDFNLVLLNGRQMPATIINSRAFDFANLASEAVSALEIYKTSHADIPTGGIGATINIKTARPLDAPGLIASIAAKAVMDQSVDQLPQTFRGKSATPEISAIFSNTWADGRFGASASFSYQKRDSGFSEASVNAGWPAFRGDDDNPNTRGRLPLPGEPNYENITNRPGPDAVYALPQNFTNAVIGVQRQRRNGQIALQFAPMDNITATLDYTYADNRTQRQRSELSVWFNFEPGASTWTQGPVAAPLYYSEYIPAGTQDLSMAGYEQDVRNELKSLGFNLEWQVNDQLDLALDWHDSRAEVRPDHPFGSSRQLGVAAFIRGTTAIDFSRAFPVLNVELGQGLIQVEPEHAMLTGSSFANDFNRSDVAQWQASGSFRFADYQTLDFGLGSMEVDNRTAWANMPRSTWGGVGTPADYDDSIWYADHIGRYFDRFSGHDDPHFTDRFLIADFSRLHARAIEITGRPDWYRAPDDFEVDRRTSEKSRNAWLQWRTTFDWILPTNVALGMRYENTKVISPAKIVPPVGHVEWISFNEMFFALDTAAIDSIDTGKYHYWLPSVDIRIDLRENLLLRGSYGKSIGRAGWESLQGGIVVDRSVGVQGGVGSRGNPGLRPLESKNFDLSLEWYYGEGSYASVGYFRKNIRNFISDTFIREQPYVVRTPVGGEFWTEALESGCRATQLDCIRDYIFFNHADDPSVNHTGQNNRGQQEGTISARATDPIMGFDLVTPVNQRADKLYGWEISLQHMFGSTGFGIASNYTKVDSGLTYDDTSLGVQYPMVGLSDSANFVLFYEKYGWQVRAAYNWRDQFLSGISGSGVNTGTNPDYTESYGQLDMNVIWSMNAHLSFFAEAINLTDETRRVHGRHRNMLRFATQTGPRYMAGLRYLF